MEVSSPTAGPLTAQQMRTLSALADAVIPSSEAFGVPGAGDPTIVEAIVGDAGRRLDKLAAALALVDQLADEAYGSRFAELSKEGRDQIGAVLRETHPSSAHLVASLTMQCYYRDDRVMRSLGMEPRPPHPEGYEIKQGDWSLLEPVRGREAFYRR